MVYSIRNVQKIFKLNVSYMSELKQKQELEFKSYSYFIVNCNINKRVNLTSYITTPGSFNILAFSSHNVLIRIMLLGIILIILL